MRPDCGEDGPAVIGFQLCCPRPLEPVIYSACRGHLFAFRRARAAGTYGTETPRPATPPTPGSRMPVTSRENLRRSSARIFTSRAVGGAPSASYARLGFHTRITDYARVHCNTGPHTRPGSRGRLLPSAAQVFSRDVYLNVRDSVDTRRRAYRTLCRARRSYIARRHSQTFGRHTMQHESVATQQLVVAIRQCEGALKAC